MTKILIRLNLSAVGVLKLLNILTGTLLFLASFSAFANECKVAVELGPIKKADIKDPALEFLAQSPAVGGLDFQFWYKAKADRFFSGLEIRKAKKQKKLSAKLELLAIDDQAKINWMPGIVHFVDFGSQGDLKTRKPYKIESLRTHFKQQMPENLSQIANLSLDAVADFNQLTQWMQRVRFQAIALMESDGIFEFNNPKISELYLDRVLSMKAAKNGFKIQKNGLPFDVTQFSEDGFWKVLADKKLFVDWTGIGLVGGNSKVSHSARGHLFFLAYLSEVVPGFAELIKYIGVTKDKDGFWQFTTDNAASDNTGLYSGYWVQIFGKFLNIRY